MIVVYTCPHCGKKFDRLYLGLQLHCQAIHASKYNFQKDILPYCEAVEKYERTHKPKMSAKERRDKTILFCAIMGLTVLITFIATFSIGMLSDEGEWFLIVSTALVWVAWMALTIAIVLGLGGKMSSFGDIAESLERQREWLERIKNLPDGVPCGHLGCLSHVSHPCEGCGRIAGVRSKNNTTININYVRNEESQ